MKYYIYTLFVMLFVISSCEIDEEINPNNPALENILSGANNTDLSNLVTGILASMRNSHSITVTASGTIARELYLFDADPRNRTDLIGVGTDILDNSSFYTTAPWAARYRTIKNLNILLEAAENAGASVSQGQKDGYIGFANTLMAHQFLAIINAQNDNGARIDVSDPNSLGEIVSKSEVFDRMTQLVNDGFSSLTGSEFAFTMSSGFEEFDTPTGFATFNRALAAKIELFKGNYTTSLSLLDDSFFDLNGDLSAGPKMSYSTAGGDLLNGLFKSPDQNGDQIVVNNDFINDAEAGDLRVATKTAMRANPTLSSGVGGTHETRLFATNSSAIDILRNEELVLIYAEAKLAIGGAADLVDAENALNIIRSNAGLNDLATAKPSVVGDKDLLLDEMLHQRRYSLWGEGHRMIDLRRYDRLNTTFVQLDVIADPDDNADQQVFTEFPIPSTEN